MRSARSPLLLLLLGVAFALCGPRPPTSRSCGQSPSSDSGGRSECSIPDLTRCETFPDESRRCGEPEERFFYNVTSKSCEPFIYHGCPENRNSYRSLIKCHHYCGEADFCQLPPEHGPCNDKPKTRRWFYDPETQDCKKFTYGGCGGNANNFHELWKCRKRCHKGLSQKFRGWKPLCPKGEKEKSVQDETRSRRQLGQ